MNRRMILVALFGVGSPFFDRLWTGQRQGQGERQGSRQGRSASRPRWRLLPARGLCNRAALLQRAERSAAGLAQEVLSNRQIAARMGEEDSTFSTRAGACASTSAAELRARLHRWRRGCIRRADSHHCRFPRREWGSLKISGMESPEPYKGQ